jgi:hypothetical protein
VQPPSKHPSSNGSVRLSSAIKALATQFSDVDRTQRSFIGHFDLSEWAHEAEAKWTGDELYVEAEIGNMNVYFDDEVDFLKSKSPNIFERIYQDFDDGLLLLRNYLVTLLLTDAATCLALQKFPILVLHSFICNYPTHR